MIMTYQPRRHGKLSKRLIEILQAAPGEWLSRSEIGARFGRRLQPYDIAVLEFLAAEGEIESREAIVGQVKTRWEYRVKQ